MTNKQPINPNAHSFDNADSQNNVHSRKATPDEVSYRNGYVEGQSTERSQAIRDQQIRDQYAREQIRESNGVANGMAIGLAFAALAGIVAGALYFVNRSEPTPTTPVVVPASPQSQQPQRNTTIIERTIDRTKEAAPDVKVPNVEINVPQPVRPSSESTDQSTGESTNSAPKSQSEAPESNDVNEANEQTSESNGNNSGNAAQ